MNVNFTHTPDSKVSGKIIRMTQVHKSRKSDNPFIETIWHTESLDNGVYLATPDASWDLIIAINADGSKLAFLTGQATKPQEIPYEKGSSSLVVSFTPGAYMPEYPGDTLLDKVEFLPNFDENHFMLAGHTFAFPTFETAEQLIEKLVNLGILASDKIVDDVMKGKRAALSERAVQRHFVRTTGMTQKYLEQIHRAQLAVRLLKRGEKPLDAAADAGYTDQSRLSKSLKKIMNRKPSDITEIHKL